MPSAQYEQHLNSAEWQVSRARVVLRAAGWCEECRTRPLREVHHLSYRRFGHEPDDDLIGLCFSCHDGRHGRSARSVRATGISPLQGTLL